MDILKLPIIRGIHRKTRIVSAALNLYIPPGHYYSPIINPKEVAENADKIFTKAPPVGIDLNIPGQLALVSELATYGKDFAEEYLTKTPKKLYSPENGFYSHKDAIFLYSFMRHFKPKRVIEVGSGYSSALMQDVVNEYLPSTHLTFIEPYPEDRLKPLLRSANSKAVIYHDKVQNVDVSVFKELQENDILFIDSSHVSKVGSDLNYLLFEVIPHLSKGVLIHFHDIYYPFQYPKDDVLGKRFFSWNEPFLLRAFLNYNNNFKIRIWNSFLEHNHSDLLKEKFPFYFNRWGASIWIQRIN